MNKASTSILFYGSLVFIFLLSIALFACAPAALTAPANAQPTELPIPSHILKLSGNGYQAMYVYELPNGDTCYSTGSYGSLACVRGKE